MRSPSRRLRIAFVAYRGNMNSGGQGIYLWFLAREMARLGHEVSVFVGPPYPDEMPFARWVEKIPNQQFWAKWVLGQSSQIVPRERPLQVLSPLNFYELAVSRIGFLPEPLAFSIRSYNSIVSRLRAGAGFDIVHDIQSLGFGLLGLRALGIPVVSTVHHPLTVDRRASLVRDRDWAEVVGTMKFYPVAMQAFVARRLECILTSSEISARQISRDFGVPPTKLRNVHNGLDTSLFSPDPTVERVESQVLCVGRSADPNKGIETLIDALSRLPPHIKLTLVDDDAPESLVRKWASRSGVSDRVRLTGRVAIEELVHLYRQASLVVVPSRYEGFGLPAVEAMACGTPVVATRAGALPEVLDMTGGGVLANRDDPASLAGAIRNLLEDSSSRIQMADRGRKHTVESFSWPRVAATTAQVYAEIVDSWVERRRGRPATTTTSARNGH